MQELSTHLSLDNNVVIGCDETMKALTLSVMTTDNDFRSTLVYYLE